MNPRIAIAIALVANACASGPRPVGPLLVEGRDNDLAATSKYGSQELWLTGVVVHTGQKRIDHGSASRTTDRWVESQPAATDVPYPFVQLRDQEHPTQDVAVCYFAESDADRVTKLPAEAVVRVRGFFVQYAVTGGHLEAVLNHCSFAP